LSGAGDAHVAMNGGSIMTGTMQLMRLILNGAAAAIAAITALTIPVRPLAAQDAQKPTTAEEKAKLARRGAGALLGSWALVDNPATGSASTSDSPLAIGYFRSGLDQHLAMETTVGIWKRDITVPASGGLGGSSGGKTSAILLPQLTSLRLYPFTTPADELEPYVTGGVGFTLGFQSQSGSGGVLGGGGGGSGLMVGVGGSGGAGVEWRFSNAFGLTAGAHYTYIQFFDDLAGERMYRGTGLTAGLTYRFQY
jgi:hypothetical protein